MSDPPRYIISCFLGSPVLEYQRELVDLIAGRFGLTVTQQQAIPAHFTLKYHFATRDIGEVERQARRLEAAALSEARSARGG